MSGKRLRPSDLKAGVTVYRVVHNSNPFIDIVRVLGRPQKYREWLAAHGQHDRIKRLVTSHSPWLLDSYVVRIHTDYPDLEDSGYTFVNDLVEHVVAYRSHGRARSHLRLLLTCRAHIESSHLEAEMESMTGDYRYEYGNEYDYPEDDQLACETHGLGRSEMGLRDMGIFEDYTGPDKGEVHG